MSWSTFSPELGMVPQDYNSTDGSLAVELPLRAGHFNPDSLSVFFRTTFGIMGVAGVQESVTGDAVKARMFPRGPIAEEFLHDLGTGKYGTVDGQTSLDPKGERKLAVAHAVDMSKHRPVSEEELRFAKDYGDIAIRAEHVMREGGFRIRLSDAVSIPRESKLVNGSTKAEQNRRTLAIHGRAGGQHFTRLRALQEDRSKASKDPFHIEVDEEESVQDLLRGRASFSLASYTGVMQQRAYTRTEDGSYKELPWNLIEGSGLIEKFALGLLDRHNKHVVLYAENGEQIRVKPSDIWIDVDVYQPYSSEMSQSTFFKGWHDLSKEAKLRMHERGADLVQVLDLEDPKKIEALFDYSRLERARREQGKPRKTYFANVLSPNGLTPIGILHSEREFAREELIEGVRLEGRYRELPEEYEDLGEVVGNIGQATHEGARVVVIDTLPDHNMLNVLYEEGVRGVVFKNLSTEATLWEVQS